MSKSRNTTYFIVAMQCKRAKRSSFHFGRRFRIQSLARPPARPSCCCWCRISPYPRRLTAEGNDLCLRRSHRRRRRLWQQSRRRSRRGLGGWQRSASVRPSVIVVRGGGASAAAATQGRHIIVEAIPRNVSVDRIIVIYRCESVKL